ncbi:MAG: replicative DNA helicase, partial [Anaerolineae bacterium]
MTMMDETTSTGAQMLPHSREAEEAVLGAILLNPEAYFDVAAILEAEDFYIHRNRWVWQAIERLQQNRMSVDVLSVGEELERQGQLAEVGGTAYLTALVTAVPSAMHAETYARIVEETAVRRRMLEAANQIARLAYEEETALEEVMGDAEKALFGVSNRRLTRDMEPIRVTLSEYYDRISKLSRSDEEIRGVPTGFIDLDRLLGGLQPSDLLIVAGRPGMGKTGFALSVAKNAALTHKK